ncbi:patatin-like phospholipase family protein [Fusibacter sp. JL216-2]|uniref:patatin-like phospholipase family protein n=1 Tax=Fusibacter sp. JL216-2 TaxID=3071453 RepID=UPI003D355ACE
MEKTALILEGGGFRGLFTSGVLDYFLENQIRFPYVIGVSMGACNGASYISNQHGRNKIVNMGFVNDKRYMSYRRLFLKGELFGMDFVFRTVPNGIVPYDFEAYENSDQVFKIVVTDIEKGKPIYLNKPLGMDLMDALQASASLPFISKPVEIDGRLCLDGGISDSIPIRKALEDGYDKFVIILTQPRDFVKESTKATKLAGAVYRKYPELKQLLSDRHNNYNKARSLIFDLEKEGKALVIEPREKIPAGRIEKNEAVLQASFDMGYEEAKTSKDRLFEFLQIHNT